ncbi:MAG TPA: type II toxin-antitoxin system prevent-host-death family antitoxin [Methylocella sp.]|jgi:prevent-host-death family protein
MGRFRKAEGDWAKNALRRAHGLLSSHWLLQDTKAHFREVVRRGCREGPQHVTHGRDEVVVVSAEDFRRLQGERGGDALSAPMQASPCRDIDIEPKRDRMPMRGVDL